MLALRTRADLEQLIADRTPESLTLDYKRSQALGKSSDQRRELVKDVTAFANAAGGQLIYGIREERTFPQALDEGVDISQISLEFLDQVISSNTSPRVQGIRIRSVPIDEQGTRFCVLIDIPQAVNQAPHQNTLDHKYYRRFELRAVPMYDYEIRDVMNRSVKPDLFAFFKIGDNATELELSPGHNTFAFTPHFENKSDQAAEYSMFNVYIDSRLRAEDHEVFRRSGPEPHGEFSLDVFQIQFKVPEHFPLVSGSHITVNPRSIKLRIMKPDAPEPQSYLVGYTALGPNIRKSEYGIILQIGRKLVLRHPFDDDLEDTKDSGSPVPERKDERH